MVVLNKHIRQIGVSASSLDSAVRSDIINLNSFVSGGNSSIIPRWGAFQTACCQRLLQVRQVALGVMQPTLPPVQLGGLKAEIGRRRVLIVWKMCLHQCLEAEVDRRDSLFIPATICIKQELLH